MRVRKTQQEFEEDGYQVSPVQRLYSKSGTCYTVPVSGNILYSSTDARFLFFTSGGKIVLVIEEENVEARVYDSEYNRV